VGRPYDSEEWIEGKELIEPCFAAERRGVVAHSIGTHDDLNIALQASEERYRYTVALSPLIPWIADAHGGVIDIDVRGLECTGLTYEACLGAGFLSAIHVADHGIIKTAWRRARRTGQPFDYEMRLRRPDGAYRWHHCRAAPRLQRGGGIHCWYGTIEDVDDRRAADQALRWTADHDDLTGLWNRRAFMEGLRKAIAGAEGSGIEVALLLIDLDGFKLINDRYGHDAGDALLKEVARRLERVGTGDAMAGRLGGDEFAVFVFTPDRDQLEDSLAALKQALAIPYSLNGQAHSCRASIGVAIYPGHGADSDALYKNADLALYEAKSAGGGIRFFQSAMRATLHARLSQLSTARFALDHDQVLPFYQPKVDLGTGAVVGFEALLRWTHGTLDARGVQAPGMIPAAFEDAELAIALDERIFDRVTADIRRWEKAGLAFGRIAINISASEFRHDDFAEQFLARVERSGIAATALELEVTETVLIGRSPHKMLAILERLRSAGMTIALDDFGTGYASLIHLKQFPVDVLKIDCSFVQALEDPTNAAIVRAIVGLGKQLGITTVAEGVETEAQATRLRRKGCNQAQGYLFSPAVPAARVPEFLINPCESWILGDRRSGRDRRVFPAQISG
jgi:diguanylate cyclase (GGDEF)-like protein/PAS domain S-box-containing protein